MFETLRRHPILVFNNVARDPLDAFAAFQEALYGRIEPINEIEYVPDPGWENDLHQCLDITPEAAVEGFWPLWSTVVGALRAQGLAVGPYSFHAWNDGDAGFVRAIWCLVRHLRPVNVVETGVAHGMTSRFILEALENNGTGALWSIDLPPVNPESRREVGVAVHQPGVPVRRWNYIAGTSRRRLPALLARLGQVDLFIHDSMHSNRNVLFELESAWGHLRPGGVLVVDDIDSNQAFDSFTKRHPDHRSFICTAEPLGPDMRRFNQKGLFGIICKRA
jgi:Methyltransferase domain